MLWVLLAGCEPQTLVELSGVVWDGAGEDALSLPDAEVQILGQDGEPLGRTTSGPDGSFEVEVPGGTTVFAVIRKDGYATTTFPGTVGVGYDTQRVEDHVLYGVTLDDADALTAAFEGCPGVDGSRAAVYGQVQVYGLSDAETGGAPTVGTAIASVRGGGKDQQRDACYYDWSGDHYEVRARETGPSGGFAVFDVEPGWHEIDVDVEVAPAQWMTQGYPVWIPDDPVVLSPWFPLWVDFPF